jgi:DNA segregation ATPase FtsK/SpoIIIE, S-DNA-T family
MLAGMDYCAQCDFRYEGLDVEDIPDTLGCLGTAYRSRLATGFQDAYAERLLRRRPAPDVWSALEYCCHVRDVLLAQRERLYLALVEDTPRFPSIYRDQRVLLARYSADRLEDVAGEVEMAAGLLARAFARLDDGQWQRRCIYTYPAPMHRTIAWLVRHTVHEGRHHLHDVDAVINAARSAVTGGAATRPLPRSR